MYRQNVEYCANEEPKSHLQIESATTFAESSASSRDPTERDTINPQGREGAEWPVSKREQLEMADESVNEAETDAFSGLAEPERQRPTTCQPETQGWKRRGVSLSKDLRFPSTNSDTIEPYEARMGIDHQAKVRFRAPARPNELTSKNMRDHVSTARVIQIHQNPQHTVRDDPILGTTRGKGEGCLKQVFRRGSYQHACANLHFASHLPVDTVSRDVWPCPILRSTEIRECGNTENWVQM